MKKTLQTVISKVEKLENKNNSKIILDFYKYKLGLEIAENTQENILKMLLNYCEYLKSKNITEIKNKNEIIKFLDTKKSNSDLNEKWKSTYNTYLIAIKQFFRWFYNRKKRDKDNWETPPFLAIPLKKIKTLSPYSEKEIWTKEELEKIISYEGNIRNKTIMAMLWDFNSRPHEITTLKIKDIVFKNDYAHGKISPYTKTGSREILLTLSFPYARDYLNLHPNKNEGDSYFIVNMKTGDRIEPDSIRYIMLQLKKTIKRNLEKNIIKDEDEREELFRLLREKKWNPYCFRHSSITSDSDYLTDSVLVKKVGWNMNTKQRARYIKTSFSEEMRNTILSRNGIEVDESKKQRKSNIICGRCDYVNGIDAQLCSKCGYALSQEALNKIKEDDIKKIKDMMNKEILLMKFNNFVDRLLEHNQQHRAKIVEEITSKNNGKLDKNIDPLTIQPQDQLKAYLASPEGKRLTSKQITILEECIQKGEIGKVSLMGIDKDDYNSDYPTEYDEKGLPIIRF